MLQTEPEKWEIMKMFERSRKAQYLNLQDNY
jgi:hypothetical protein